MKYRIYYLLIAFVILTGTLGILKDSVSYAGFKPSLNAVSIFFNPVITPEKFKKQIVLLVNEERLKDELEPLIENPELDASAKSKGDDMFAQDYWAHNSPDGNEPWVEFIDAGYSYRYAGENLARNFTSAEETVLAWMNSPTHRSAILNPDYTETGVWAGEGKFSGIDTFLIVQHFASPR